MSDTRFTPGPWEVYSYHGCIVGERPGIEKIGDENKSIIVFNFENEPFSPGVCGDSKEERYANARLIAAAPDMYEKIDAALKEWDILPSSRAFTIAEITDWLARFMGPAMDDLRAILVKADGVKP